MRSAYGANNERWYDWKSGNGNPQNSSNINQLLHHELKPKCVFTRGT